MSQHEKDAVHDNAVLLGLNLVEVILRRGLAQHTGVEKRQKLWQLYDLIKIARTSCCGKCTQR